MGSTGFLLLLAVGNCRQCVGVSGELGAGSCGAAVSTQALVPRIACVADGLVPKCGTPRYGRWSLLSVGSLFVGDALTVTAGVLKEPLWSFVANSSGCKALRYGGCWPGWVHAWRGSADYLTRSIVFVQKRKKRPRALWFPW